MRGIGESWGWDLRQSGLGREKAAVLAVIGLRKNGTNGFSKGGYRGEERIEGC